MANYNWISVDDYMPSNEQTVFVKTTNDSIYLCTYKGGRFVLNLIFPYREVKNVAYWSEMAS